MKRTPTRPAVVTFDIHQFRRGRNRRTWAAYASPPSPELCDIGEGIDSTRREVAAQILEKVASEIREGRHKASIIVSITHCYLHEPAKQPDHPEIAVQARALRELADGLERQWGLHPSS